MKIYISVDIEGLAGIVSFSQESEEKQRFRRAMHNQLEWVIEGIHASKMNQDITEITIADSHGTGMNLDYDTLSDLDERIALISGYPRPNYMMPCFDESYDVVFFVGYHGAVGELDSNMDHTYASRAIHRIKINGVSMSETQINAAYAAEFQVPIGLVIGDTGLLQQLQQAMPWVKMVCTKQSISRFAAKYYPKQKIRQATIEAVQEVLASDLSALPCLHFEKPYRLEIEFNFGSQFDIAMTIPKVQVVDGRTIELVVDDYKELFEMIMMIVYCVRKAHPFS